MRWQRLDILCTHRFTDDPETNSYMSFGPITHNNKHVLLISAMSTFSEILGAK